jgi:thiamine monophosphate synthase
MPKSDRRAVLGSCAHVAVTLHTLQPVQRAGNERARSFLATAPIASTAARRKNDSHDGCEACRIVAD